MDHIWLHGSHLIWEEGEAAERDAISGPLSVATARDFQSNGDPDSEPSSALGMMKSVRRWPVLTRSWLSSMRSDTYVLTRRLFLGGGAASSTWEPTLRLHCARKYARWRCRQRSSASPSSKKASPTWIGGTSGSKTYAPNLPRERILELKSARPAIRPRQVPLYGWSVNPINYG